MPGMADIATVTRRFQAGRHIRVTVWLFRHGKDCWYQSWSVTVSWPGLGAAGYDGRMKHWYANEWSACQSALEQVRDRVVQRIAAHPDAPRMLPLQRKLARMAEDFAF